MKILIQIPKKFNFIFILIVITSFIQLGCKSRNSDKEKAIIRNMESVFCLESPSLNPSINKSGFQNSDNLFFTVKPTLIFKDNWKIDTVYFNFSDVNDMNGSIVKEFDFQLSMDTCITVNRLETLLMNIGINNPGLKEKLFWLRELTNARLITVKNSFGDIEGYYLKTKNGDIVPKEYYLLEKMITPRTGEPCTGYTPQKIKLGAINQDGNEIRMSLNIIHRYPKLGKTLVEGPGGDKVELPIGDHIEMPDDKAILISFNGKNAYINANYEAIGLFIFITTRITFLKNGQISYLPQYTPFKFKQLN